MTEQPTCKTCRFYVPNTPVKDDPAKEIDGACRRFPPNATAIPVPMPNGSLSIRLIADFPTVKEHAWCGEHEPTMVLGETVGSA